MQGYPVEQAGASDDQANGNGSLMRVLPLALWHQGTDAELIELAQLQSVVTHRLNVRKFVAHYIVYGRVGY